MGKPITQKEEDLEFELSVISGENTLLRKANRELESKILGFRGGFKTFITNLINQTKSPTDTPEQMMEAFDKYFKIETKFHGDIHNRV